MKRIRNNSQAHADKLERGAAKGEALFARLLSRFPDPDAAIKERKARWAERGGRGTPTAEAPQ